jgi:hypothetical protein
MSFYRQILWVENVPIITSYPQTAFTLMLDEVRMYPNLLTRLEEGEDWHLYEEFALALSRRSSLSPAHQLFWRTRVTPELVPRSRLEILVPKLCVNPPPLPSPGKKTLLCSSKRTTS